MDNDEASPDLGPPTEGLTAADVVADFVPDGSELEPTTASLPSFLSHNVLVVFENNDEARDQIVALEHQGVEGSHISYLALVASDDASVSHSGVMDNEETMRADGAMAADVAKGAAVGGTLGAAGGALTGLALLAIPGVGTVAGLGLLAGVLGGAIGGGNLGAVWGGYSKLALSDAWEHTFVNVGAGSAIVGVHTDDPEEYETAAKTLPSDRARHYDRQGETIPAPDF